VVSYIVNKTTTCETGMYQYRDIAIVIINVCTKIDMKLFVVGSYSTTGQTMALMARMNVCSCWKTL